MTQQYQEVIITLNNQPEDLSEMLIAQLAELGYDGFLEEPNQLKAYISTEFFNQQDLANMLAPYQLTVSLNTIEKQNWNILWESNFSPMQVDQFVGVRASFHEPIQEVKHELIITPKMSFGTGHHETTSMMAEYILEIDIKDKTVMDMGTGTGILGILASMIGCTKIVGIDNDSWCYENAEENIEKNNINNFEMILGDAGMLKSYPNTFDVFIANINRHILLADIKYYVKSMKNPSILLLSGFYLEDLVDIEAECTKHGLKFIDKKIKKNWVCAKFELA